MKERSIKPTESKKKTLNRILIPASVLLLALIIVLFIYLANKMDWSDSWEEDDSSVTEVSAAASVIPDMTKKYKSDTRLVFYESDPENPLAHVRELETYTQTVRIITVYEETVSSERLTVTRKNDKYKVESDTRIIICDGENLYLDYGNHTITAKPDENLYFREAGMTSLADIRSMVQDSVNYPASYQISDDYRTITAEITDTAHDIRMVFDISLESGLVTAERFYMGDTAYRTVITESVDVTAQPADDIFNIPVQNQ